MRTSAMVSTGISQPAQYRSASRSVSGV